MPLAQLAVTVIFSLAIGLLMGVIGGGGGGIYVVIFMILFHQNASTAAMTALVVSTVTLSGAAFQYLRKRQFRTDYFIALSIFDIAGTLLGAIVMNHINEDALKIVILCVLVISSLSSLIKIKKPDAGVKKIAKLKSKLPVTASVGAASGLITGTTGLSASTMMSSLLIGLIDFPPHLAVGTITLVSFAGNLVSIAFLYAGGFILRSPVLHIDLYTLLKFGIGSAAGALFGAKITTRINRKVLAAALAAAAVLPGIFLALKR